MAQSGVDEKYINASVNGNLPDVPELKCYILCIFEHAGMIEDDGTIHFNDVMHLLSPSTAETAKYVSKECQTKRELYNFYPFAFFLMSNSCDLQLNSILDGDTRCDTAWLTVKCYFEKAPEVNICLMKLKIYSHH